MESESSDGERPQWRLVHAEVVHEVEPAPWWQTALWYGPSLVVLVLVGATGPYAGGVRALVALGAAVLTWALIFIVWFLVHTAIAMTRARRSNRQRLQQATRYRDQRN